MNTTKRTAKATEVRRAVTYCRISHDLNEGAGVERQRIDTDKIAKREGWAVAERIVDNDRGASRYSKRKREGWSRLLELLDQGAVDAVIAYDLDRLTRQPKELERLIDLTEKGAIEVRTVTGVLDLTSAGGRMVARQLCAVAAHEVDRLSERQKRKLQADAEQGRPHWPRRPFGYTLKGELVPAEAALVREMYDRVIDGESATAVGRWLNSTGSRTPLGAYWQSATVKFLVTSPRNAGMREYLGEIVGEGQWPAIVSMDDVRAATAALAARANGPRKGGKQRLLTRMVRCSRCGGGMVRSGDLKNSQYRCFLTKDGKERGCGMAVAANRVDREVVEQLFARLDGAASAKKGAKRVESSSATVVAELRRELDDLGAMLGAGEISMSTFKAAHAPLTARLAAAERALVESDSNAALARLVGTGADLEDRWDDLDIALRHRILKAAIDKVVIHPRVVDGPRGQGAFDPRRVEVVWAV